jgi:hypothetical protein
MKNKEAEVLIQFDISEMSEKQKEKLWKISKAFADLGISFDIGSDGSVLDWEWDWSLKGPVKVYFGDFVADVEKNRYVREKEGATLNILERKHSINQLEGLAKNINKGN